MPKFVLTIEDKPDGGFNVTGEFHPPLEKGDRMTKSQEIGYGILKHLSGIEGAEDEDDA